MNDRATDTHGRRADNGPRWRALLMLLTEVGMVAGSAIVFFAFLTVLLRFYFPQGTSLVSDDGRVADWLTAETSAELQYGTDIDEELSFSVGRILNIQRRVQRRRSNTLHWSDAQIGDTFSRNDAVQTFARSTALLEVNAESQLTVGQNSLIIFDQQHADPFVSREGSTLVMVTGELSGTLSSDEQQRFSFGVTLPNGQVSLTREHAGENVDFLITVNEDRSTTINLHGGSARLAGKDGSTRVIDEHQSVTIDATGTRMSVSELPDVPRSDGPADRRTVVYRNRPATVDFSWEPVAGADRYHLVVARDAAMSDRVVDDDVIGNSFSHGALGPGDYYWHVRSRSAWSQSAASTVRRFTVIRDEEPPYLALDSAPANTAAGSWLLAGHTEAGATVFVDDVQVDARNGRIEHEVNLEPGANIIVVRAMDAAGNLNYASISISAK